jgi:hypothetical protein
MQPGSAYQVALVEVDARPHGGRVSDNLGVGHHGWLVHR